MGTTTCIKEQCIGPGRGAVGSGGGDGGWRGGEGQSLVLSGVFVSSTDPRLQAVGDGQSLSRRGPSLSGWRHLVDKQTPPHAPPPTPPPPGKRRSSGSDQTSSRCKVLTLTQIVATGAFLYFLNLLF